MDHGRVVGRVERWQQSTRGSAAGLGRRAAGGSRLGPGVLAGWPRFPGQDFSEIQHRMMEDVWRSQVQALSALEEQLALALPWHAAEQQSRLARHAALARALAGTGISAAELERLAALGQQLPVRPGAASEQAGAGQGGPASGASRQAGPAQRMAMWADAGGPWLPREVTQGEIR